MTTALEIITEALEEIGVKEQGQTIPAEEADRARRMLNRIMGRWANMRLLFPTLTQISVPLDGSQSYTIGPLTGDIVASRPVKAVSCLARDAAGQDYRVSVLGKHEWDGIVDKTTTGGPPSDVWYEATNTLGTLHVYPVSGSEYTLILDCQVLMTEFAALATPVTLPDGYADALSLALADALCAGYGLPTMADIQRRAAGAVRAVKRTNAQAVYSQHELATGRDFRIERGF